VSQTLTDIEVRVLGSLVEKEITTPDYYPLSLNSLVAACNQSSNRNPIVHYDESTVAQALDTLRDKKLIHTVDKSESRVTKYRHVLYEEMNLGRPTIAVLCVLMLRGAQTVGEIRTRTNRLYDFTSLDEVENTLTSMMSAEPPLVVRLPRQPGQKEVRYAHLLSGEVVIPDLPESQEAAEAAPAMDDRITQLERDVEDLKRQFEQFRKQFE